MDGGCSLLQWGRELEDNRILVLNSYTLFGRPLTSIILPVRMEFCFFFTGIGKMFHGIGLDESLLMGSSLREYFLFVIILL